MRKKRAIKKLSDLKCRKEYKTKDEENAEDTKVTTNNNDQYNLQKRKKEFQETFGHTSDLIFRDILFGKDNKKASIMFLNTICSSANLSNFVIAPLTKELNSDNLQETETLLDDLMNKTLTNATCAKTSDLLFAKFQILNGHALFMIDGMEECILIEISKYEERSLENPNMERSFFGMGIGFTENLNTNLNVIRAYNKSEHLVFEKHEIGEVTKTTVMLLYQKDLVSHKVLSQVKERIAKIDVKYIQDSRVVQLQLTKRKTFFPLILRTDRPDTAISSVLQGNVVIMVNGNPYIVSVPALFVDFFHSPSDYEDNYGRFTFRLMRLINYMLTMMLPAIYLAFVKMDMALPKEIDKAIMPKYEILPLFWQLLMMIFLLRTLLDGIMRLSTNANMLVTMLGTVIIGETLTRVHIIHPLVLVIIGVVFVSGASVGNKGLQNSFTSLRQVYLILANFFGFSGLFVGVTIQIIYMANLKSMGVPYLSPIIPFRLSELKDSFIRGRLKKIVNSKHSYKS